MAIPMSTSTSNSAFSIETTSINPILNGLDPDIVEALKHAPSSANMELMLTKNREHAPSSANSELRLANHSSTSCPEPLPTDGALHKRLSCESINTVKDFLTLLFIDPARLQNILGTGISAKMWEVTVEHAQTCVLEKRMFLYSPPSSQQKNGVVFNVVGQVMGLLLECQYADAHNLVISAFKHLGEVVSFDDEASLVGSSSHLTNVCTASLPRTESSNVSKFMASHKIGAFDYTQQSAAIGRARMRWTKLFSMLIWFSIRVALRKQVLGTGRPVKMWKDTVESAQTCVLEKRMFLYSSPPSSPDIISSIYSVGGSSGFDDYDLPSVDSMGLRYEQASSFLESMKHSFDDDDLKFFYTGLF
ncbi:calmodulin-binding protein 60 a [Quercus suber]|uniref:Calmodulin-binding protein 60 a n=1 Tax=Quercus suber TaxID=58331 RepID=A0AAW0JG19_QUESU